MDYKMEDFVRAKEICTNQNNTVADILFFNRFFRTLHDYLERRYILDSNRKTIVLKDLTPSGEESIEQEASIGDFIFFAFRHWDPQRSSFLTFVDRCLKQYCMLVPASWSADLKAARTVQALIRTIRKRENRSSIALSELPDLLPKYMPHCSINDIGYAISAYSTFMSIDTSLAEGDGEDRDTYANRIPDPSFEETESIDVDDLLNRIQKEFDDLQQRTQPRVAMAICASVVEELREKLSDEEFEELAAKHPTMLVHVRWLISECERSKSFDNPLGTVPDIRQQAQKLSISYNSYCNTISQWKKRISHIYPKSTSID